MTKEVDNFKLINELLKSGPLFGYHKNQFYCLQLIRRKKDNPSIIKNANKVIKTFYLVNEDDLMNNKDEIITLCNLYNCRAYLYYSRRSCRESIVNTIKELAQRLLTKNYIMPWRVFNMASSRIKPEVSLWLIDIDDDSGYLDKLDELQEEVKKSSPYKDIVAKIPTRTGYHFLVEPFDSREFKKKYPNADIKRESSSTLVYCNL